MATTFTFNLNLNTQQFQQAIGAVGRQARNLFDQLHQFSEQYQRTGFLGQGDSRVLLQTMQAWEQMARRVHLEQLGVQGQMQALQAAGPMTQAQTRQFNQLQAQQARLQAQQQGLQTLQGGFGDWQAMQQQLLAQEQAAAGGSKLRGMAGAAGLQLLQRTGPVGQILGGTLTGAAVAGPGGAVVGGVAAAFGYVFDKATEGMRAWEARARSVAAMGQLLDQNFGGLTAQVVDLNKQFSFLTDESLQAVEAMSRFTGRRDPRALTQAAGFARAYGLAPAQAAGLAGSLAMLGVGDNPLARVAAGARTTFGGGLPMRMDLLQEEAARIASIGGTAAAPMDPEFYGRWAGFIGGMGTRYQIPGATAGFAERLAQGLTQAPDVSVRMFRMRALGQWAEAQRAAGRSTTIRVGEGPEAQRYDLGDYLGRVQALESAAESPQVMGIFEQANEAMYGADPTLRALGYGRNVLGGRFQVRESERFRRHAEQAGGLERMLTQPSRFTAAGEAGIVQGRVQTWQQAEESLPQRVDAFWQRAMEALGATTAPAKLQLYLNTTEQTEKAVQIFGQTVHSATETMKQLVEAMLNYGERMNAAMQQAQQQGWGPLAPLAGLMPDWGQIMQRLQSLSTLPAGSLDPGAGVGSPIVQPQRSGTR